MLTPAEPGRTPEDARTEVALDWMVTLMSLLPALVAIGAALATRRVVPSLGAGAIVGALVAASFSPLDAFVALWGFLANAVAPGVLEWDPSTGEGWADVDTGHIVITVFSLLVAGMIGVMGRSGGTRALVGLVEGLAKGPRGAMVASWLAGTIVFFDDYANCLVVGSSMGPLVDRFRVSRAKLAYIVDSTAAPVASLALVSTWVGYEVGLIDDALPDGAAVTGFSVFLEGLAYRFYGIFTLAFVGAIAFSGRDFGPMYDVEATSRARKPREITESTGGRGRWWGAALPVMTLVVVTFAWLWIDGAASLAADGKTLGDARLFEIVGAADAYAAMLYGSLAAFVLAVVLALTSRALPVAEIPAAAWTGIRPLLDALVVLYLAWTLAEAMGATHAADHLKLVLEGVLQPSLLPTATFIVAAFIAFATGTSFGTMSILIPLVVPLGVGLVGDVDSIVVASIAAVLAGSCLGDHASPISDTTVLSAIGAGVDLVTHVRTQLPYALTTGLISVFAGYLPVGLGVPVWVALPGGIVTCIAVVMLVGKPVPAPAQQG